jgi:predicted  nucleic acid-binding Zn-ribbon protein
MLSLQHENDELHETLARKTQNLETLRSELHSLQSKFDTLTIAKEDVDARLERSTQETLTLRNQMANAPQTDPLFLQHEILRLTKSLESKTKDFDYLAERYQESSAAASESAGQVGELKKEVEALKRRVEMDVRAVSWEGEKKVLLEKVKVLEDQYKLLEEREQRIKRKETST